MIREFNDTQATIDYLTGQLILAHQQNDLLTKSNIRLENMLMRALEELQHGKRVLDEMAHQVGELSTISLKRLTKQ